eukprot:SAG25_NODE_2594_length_1507_cov_2.133523_4_plen_46_part_00
MPTTQGEGERFCISGKPPVPEGEEEEEEEVDLVEVGAAGESFLRV